LRALTSLARSGVGPVFNALIQSAHVNMFDGSPKASFRSVAALYV